MANPWPKVIQSKVAFSPIAVTTPPPAPYVMDSLALAGIKAGFLFGDALFFGSTRCYPLGDPTHGMLGYRVQKNGDNCTYLSTDVTGRIFRGSTGENIKVIGTGQVQCGPLPQTFNIPPVFVKNTFTRVATSSFSITGPCVGGNALQTYYFPQQGYIAYLYARTFPEDYDSYIRIYQQRNDGTTVEVEAGYIGTYSTGDNFNLTGQVIPPDITTSIGVASGSDCGYETGAFYWDDRGISNNWTLGATNIHLTYQIGLTCERDFKPHNTYMTSVDSFFFSYADAPATVTQMSQVLKNSASENPLFYCNLGIATGDHGRSGNYMVIYSNAFYAELEPVDHLGAKLTINCFALFADGTCIALGQGDQSQPIQIYNAQIDLVSLGLVFQAQAVVFHNPIINGNRPVSPNGSFIA